MPTLEELHQMFGLDEGQEKTASNAAEADDSAEAILAEALGLPKHAHTTRSTDMKSLSEIYNRTVQLEKQASTQPRAVYSDDQIEKVAEQMAREEVEMKKLASEYDAAGRIMARGFMDEFNKLAAEIDAVMNDGQSPAQVETDLAAGTQDPTAGAAPKGENALESDGSQDKTLEQAKAMLGAPGSVPGAAAVVTVRDALTASA